MKLLTMAVLFVGSSIASAIWAFIAYVLAWDELTHQISRAAMFQTVLFGVVAAFALCQMMIILVPVRFSVSAYDLEK